MLEGYIWFWAWALIVLNVLCAMIPGPGAPGNQTTRVIGALLSLPALGRLLGWW